MHEDFDNKLAWGKEGEQQIVAMLNRRGYIVAYTGPASQKDPVPSIWLPEELHADPLIAPDLFVTKRFPEATLDPSSMPCWNCKYWWRNSFYVEVKRYSHWTWNFKEHEWQTGMSVRHFFNYCSVQKFIGYPVTIYLIMEGEPSPQRQMIPTPSGVYAAPLHNLEVTTRKHQYKDTMWWSIEDFSLLCTLEELRPMVVPA